MLNREIPFLRFIIPLCAGILSGFRFPPGNSFLIVFAAIICIGFSISLLFNKSQTNKIFGIITTLALFECGMLLYRLEKESLTRLEQKQGVYIGTITEYPEEKSYSFKLIIKLSSVVKEKEMDPVNGSVMVYLEKCSIVNRLLPGDRIKIRLNPLPVVNRGNPGEFDYRFYLENHGIKYFAYAGQSDLMGYSHPERRKLRYSALIIREKIINMYKVRGITEERLAIVAAMTLGQKKMLDPEQKEAFMRAGVMHIMAVSGLHAMILSLFISNMLFFLKGRLKPLRVLITVILLWAFAFVTGLTPSVLRATLMFSFLETGKIINRNVNNVNSVLASAFILIMARPSVIFDAGFLLSYSAVIFIIVFFRKLYTIMCCKTYFTDKVWQSVSVTILAQAGTLPLTISLFNRFPVWFILSNLIIVPLSSILIITGCLIPATYPIKFLSEFLAFILNHLTDLTMTITESVSRLPLASIENIGMAGIESLLLFMAIFSIALWLAGKRKINTTVPLLLIIAFLGAVMIRDIATKRSCEIIVYNTPNSTNIGIRSGKILHLFSSSASLPDEVARHCARDRLRIRQILLKEKIKGIETGGIKILICSEINNKTLTDFKPDFLVLTGSFPVMGKKFRPDSIKEIIVSPEVSPFYKIPENIKTGNSPVHIIRQTGAFTSGL